jgi:putative serine protease PepD
MSRPSTLWARSASRTARDEEDPASQRLRARAGATSTTTPPPPDPAPTRRGIAPGRRAAVIGLAASALLLAALLGSLIGGDDDDRGALPSAPQLKPERGSGGRTDVGRVYAAAGPGVVSVQARTAGGTASGTGFVVGRDGTIVTNAHVVGGANAVQVRFGDRGRRIEARVLGRDVSSDLAVVRIDPSEARGLRALPLANSDDVEVGDLVVAIGHPFALDRTATAGIVSGVGREIRAPNGFQIDEVIQTDAPINPGNSGGPLVDARGRVVGVNSQIASAGSQGNVGIGFAVPSNTVRDVLPRLRGGRAVVRPYLGVTTSPAPGSGALVHQVIPGGPADDAGVRAGTDADVIVEVDGRAVRDPDDIAAAIAGKRPGDQVRVVVLRDGRRVSLEATLGRRP